MFGRHVFVPKLAGDGSGQGQDFFHRLAQVRFGALDLGQGVQLGADGSVEFAASVPIFFNVSLTIFSGTP